MTGEQLDLVDACRDAERLQAAGAKVRRDARPTSAAAAERALGRSGTARRRVLECLVAHPATDEELQACLGLGPNTQRPRRVELVELGFVEPSGDTRATGTGSPAVVWRATEAGRRALAAASAA